MATLKAIRTALQTVIEGAAGVKTYARVPASPILPCVIVQPSDITVQAMGRGTVQRDFDLIVLVALAADDVAQDQLDDLIDCSGAKSIWQAIWSNRSLGLAGVDAVVYGMSNYNIGFEAVNVPHLGAQLRLAVTSPGTS